MTMFRAFEDSEREALPEAFARSRQAFGGGGLWCLVLMPDGSGLRVFPPEAGKEDCESERLSSAEMLAEVMTVFGVDALKVQ